jgi:hypothetical protein
MPAMKSGAATHLGVVSTVLANFRAVEITHTNLLSWLLGLFSCF